MMKVSVLNISQTIRDLKAMTSGPNSIYNAGGRALRDMLLEHFKSMVRETPQWTGTTAASYHVKFEAGLRSSVGEDFIGDETVSLAGEVTVMPRIDNHTTDASPFHQGMEPACQISINRAMATIPINLKDYLRQDLFIINNAPGFPVSEKGIGLRAVNQPGYAMARFKIRVENSRVVADFGGSKLK